MKWYIVRSTPHSCGYGGVLYDREDLRMVVLVLKSVYIKRLTCIHCVRYKNGFLNKKRSLEQIIETDMVN